MENTKRMWAIGFWSGAALMCLINIIKIKLVHKAVEYDWIMLGVALIFLIITVFLIKPNNK